MTKIREAAVDRLGELLGKTKQKLLELAKELGLEKVSKLSKAELARRVHDAWEARHAAGHAAEAAGETVKAAVPKAARAAVRTVAVVARKEVEFVKAVARKEAELVKAVTGRKARPARPASGRADGEASGVEKSAAKPVPPLPDPLPRGAGEKVAEASPSKAEEAAIGTPPAKATEVAPGTPPAKATEVAPETHPSTAKEVVPGAVPSEPPSPAAAARLDLGPGAAAEPREEHIPWGYAQDRVTAMAVDPATLYVYWEVTDPTMDRARAELGAEGEGAWLDLRVYDITGLIFDGSNAHSFFDHGVGRSDRQWFFSIGKPSSSAVVELGMRSPRGAFERIARSSRVDFPRDTPAPWSDPEWMTVLESGEAYPAGRGAPAWPGEEGEPPPPGPGAGGERVEHVPAWILLEPGEGERRFRELFGEAFERIEWQEVHGGGGWYELQGRLEWQVGPFVSSWEAGPFSYPVEVEPPTRESWQGGAMARTIDGVTRVVYGPWQVVIRNLGGRARRAELGRWQIFRSWATRGGIEEVRWSSDRAGGAPGGASERVGASAWLRRAGSEVRLGGASELWRLGASEVRLGGASEIAYAGASERRLAGASERRLAGASEWRLAGASERRLGGASEQRLGGASESRLGGASERRLGGASEGRLGASERRLGGASEQRPSSGEGYIGGEPWPRRG